MRLKSLVFLPTGKTVFLECLTRAGLRAPDSKAWSSSALNIVLDDLRRQRLLTDDLACAPVLLHPVAVDAMEAAEGAVLVEAVRKGFPAQRSHPTYYAYSQPPDPDALRRLIRLAIYANDEAGFTVNHALHDKAFAPNEAAGLLVALFAGIPLAPNWVASRRPAIQLALFEAQVSAFLQTGVAGPGLLALIAYYRAQRGTPALAGARRVLLRHDLLTGRLADLRHGLRQVEDPADVLRNGLEGAIAFLEGDNAAALQHYRAALKLHRKQTGKRKVFLDGVHGLLFLMALLRANEAGLPAEAQAGLDVATRNASPYFAGFLAMQALFWLAQGLEAKARELLRQLRAAMPTEPLSAACIALAEYTMDADLARGHRADLAARFEGLKDQLPLVARIHAEILSEVATTPTPYQAYLAETGSGFGVAFTQLIQTRQPWERALESLDAFLASGGLQADPGKATPKAKRLVWFVDPETQHVEVAEQTPKGKGSWTDGRPVAMKRLYERDPRLNYLTEQDRTALRSIRKEAVGWYGDESYSFDTSRTIPALVGHPAVFDARQRSRPLELVRYPLELVVTEGRGGYRIGLSHTADAPTVFIEAETPTRYRVVEFPQRMLAVQEVLGRHGLKVPQSARNRLLALVRRSDPALPIRAEIDAVMQEVLEGASAPVVQLMPEGDDSS